MSSAHESGKHIPCRRCHDCRSLTAGSHVLCSQYPDLAAAQRNEEADVGSDPKELWTLHVDGSSNASGAGARLTLTDPEGNVAGYILCFEFPTTNNKTEYEALLARLKEAREARAQHLKVFSDSQLVMGHIKGEYEP